MVRVSVQAKVINTDYFMDMNSENKPGFTVDMLGRVIKTCAVHFQLWEMMSTHRPRVNISSISERKHAASL